MADSSDSQPVFPVPKEEFTSREEFNEYLSENYSSLSKRDLYLIAGVTDLDREEFTERLNQKGWEETEDLGAVKKIKKEYTESRRAESYYTYDDEKEVVLFYTDQRKTEEIEGAIEPILRGPTGIHYLYISPRVLKNFREDLVDEYRSAKVTQFVAKRTERTKTSAEYRPSSRRTFNYYGKDGLDTLREVERDYGVLPHIMQISIPDSVKFRVNKDGLFKYQSGSLSILFENIQNCIESSLRIKEAYESTSFEMLSISDSLSLPTSKPAAISLRNHLEYGEVDEIKSNLEDSDYVFLEPYAEEGSLYLAGTVYDEDNNTSFKLRANQDEIRVFPEEENDIGTFYDFVEFIQTSLDERAKVSMEGA